MKNDKSKCAICGNNLVPFGLEVIDPEMVWGNNPEPVINDASARCCDRCNMDMVIPMRMAKSIWQENENI